MKIRFAKADDISGIERICNSFVLTSFDTDTRMNINGGKYLFEFYAKRAVMKFPSMCFVAEEAGVVYGFLIFGVDSDMGERLGVKVGNIILLGVSKDFQGKGVGRALVSQATSHFDKSGFKLVHVGTDSDNIAALRSYQRNGFVSAFSWATLRLYSEDRKEIDSDVCVFSPVTEKKEFANIVQSMNIYRTHSFFYDRFFPIDTVREKHISLLLSSLEALEIKAWVISYNRKNIGFATVREDKWQSSMSGKRVLRIEDLFIEDEFVNNDIIVESAVEKLVGLTTGYDIVEIWLALNRFSVFNALIKHSFKYVHSAEVLHRINKEG